MPIIQFPDGTYRTDSTPIILDLERLHPNRLVKNSVFRQSVFGTGMYRHPSST
jgi:hypothetical protein